MDSRGSPAKCVVLSQVLPPPAGYVPIRTPARKLTATPTPLGGMTGFHMQTEDRTMKSVSDQPSGNLPFLKPDDIQYFDKLLVSDASSHEVFLVRELETTDFIHLSIIVGWCWRVNPESRRAKGEKNNEVAFKN